ncbi:hypothetical protein BLA29_010921 [Euroglyphus maynei]|uniref:Uncharacterized protein n=1 Tax=Euroglyphus maynei TaxID=6958 RepID=A0A1Y3BIV2_EURMA|nr:hypothetical protein BLA29_010921 [Euroglyphus maynei]
MATNNCPKNNPVDSVTAVIPTNSKTMHKFGHRNSSMNGPSTNRLIRSFALFDNRDFLPRPFQVRSFRDYFI